MAMQPPPAAAKWGGEEEVVAGYVILARNRNWPALGPQTIGPERKAAKKLRFRKK